MATVHFATMACEPIAAYKAQRKPNFYNIFPCAEDIK